ncbi:MAG: translocation/assembly module TamB domain-containing protein [Proteobacteria bacterium]|nr:translocation/assembly module TamB domain-containing protein [Pseudomonadota bacterium]
MRRRYAMFLGLLLALAGGLALFLHWLLFTQQGLEFALAQLGRLPTLKIEVRGARGSIAGPLTADSVTVEHEAAHVVARGLALNPEPSGLIVGHLGVERLTVSRLEVTLKERPPQPEKPPYFLPAGLRITAPDFRLGNIALTLKSGQRIEARAATGSLSLTRWRLDLDPVDVRAPDGRISGNLTLRASEPLGLRTDLRGEWRLPDDAFEYRFRVVTRGNLDRLGADIFLDAPAKLTFAGTLLDLTEQARAKGTFRMTAFDGSPWVPAGRLPQLTGTITLAAGHASLGIDGTLTSPALPNQQLRVQGAGRWEERTISLANLQVWLPRMGLTVTSSGTIELPAADAPEGTLPLLALNGDWSALQWPVALDGEPVVKSPQGVYTLEGSLPYRFSTRAQVEGPAIPSTSFEAAGIVSKTGVVLDRFEGYALRGRINGRGALSWSGNQAWNFDVDAQALAVSELRPGVDGRVSAKGNIAGAGLSAAAPWTARLVSLSGTMFGRPLTGRGEIAHRNGMFDLRDVRIANGTSFVDLNGRVGTNAVDLDWNVDLRSLAVVLPGMTGTLVSRGSARGAPFRPVIAGTARVRHFDYAGVQVASFDAEADIDSSDQRRSAVAFSATTLDAAGLAFDFARGSLEGFVGEHRITLDFASPGDPEHRIAEFRGEFIAEGGYDLERNQWAGDLSQADIQFNEGNARLMQPAALVLGPALQRTSPLCLRTDQDSRLCVEGERHAQPQSWRVLYSAEDWPLQRILRSLLGWREFDGRLQASGWAEKSPGKEWIGGSTLLVHEPTINVQRNKFRVERIRLGSSRFDLLAEPTQIRANLDIDIDETTKIQGAALVQRRAGAPLDSTLSGRITGTSEAIKVLPLLVPEIDRAAGRLEGNVVLGGTVGQPTFNGDFQVRDGTLELYRTNLKISALQADGSFDGDALKFDAQGETAKGKLTIDGKFTWPDGVMTGSMRLRGERLLVADTPELRVIASPDIVLRAGANGFEVEGEVAIPNARISPREITTTISTSPDERIVGLADVEDTEPSSADRVTSRIKVVLGDAVRVDAYGLKARLEGSVTVSTVPDDVPRGNGVIRVVEGQYRAFGQDVRITRGTLTFNDSPLNEPVLDIVAERRIKDADITVAVNVRGTIAQPFVTITSQPSMSSNEALSYLLTGRSIDTLQSGEAANINQAAESLAVSGGGLLLGGLGTRLGLDEVSVERTGEDDTSVVLGKALSPDLYVSYGISIAEAINTIKLRYTLNQRWSLKAEAGIEQSADIEYRIER